MNYRHAYHAGNAADVLKHALLAWIIAYLGQKPAPFRVIDTHAGIARYDLTGEEAQKTGEWRGGIGRLWGAALPDALALLLDPYLAAVSAANPDGALRFYPGSPLVALAGMRADDRLIACELHPDDAESLADTLARDGRAKVIHLDGWTALNAFVPPPERRGLVLVDPPFETPGEMRRLTDALIAAHAKWPTGLYMAWLPVKDAAITDTLARDLRQAGLEKWLICELSLDRPMPDGPLVASAVAILNPPWTLADLAATALPELAAMLGPRHARSRLQRGRQDHKGV
jgi:23S rRNA (adenine2030-N6)-methyltransferase